MKLAFFLLLLIPFSYANYKNGAYFQYVGTYKTYLYTNDMRVVTTTSDLTILEDTFKTARRSREHAGSQAVNELEQNLHKIFQIARLNHNDYQSDRFRSIPSNQLGRKIRDASYDALLLTHTLDSLWKDSFADYFNTTRYMYDHMNEKHLLTYRADMEISKSDGTFKLLVRQFIPHFVNGDLYKVFYTTRKDDSNCTHTTRVADQSVRYLMIVGKDGTFKEHFMKIKDLDDCDIVNKTLLCDPMDGTFDENSKEARCLKALYKDEDNIERFCEFVPPSFDSTNCLN